MIVILNKKISFVIFLIIPIEFILILYSSNIIKPKYFIVLGQILKQINDEEFKNKLILKFMLPFWENKINWPSFSSNSIIFLSLPVISFPKVLG